MQTIFRKGDRQKYVVLDKEFLNNKEISLKAKGLLAYLLSLPDDWEFHPNEIVRHHKDGEYSVRSAFKELIKNNYIEFKQERDEKSKKYLKSIYIIYEVPKVKKPHVENRNAENHHILNTDELINKAAAEKAPADSKLIKEEKIRKEFANLKLGNKFFNQLINEFTLEQIEDKLESLKYRKNIKNTAAYLRSILKADYPNKDTPIIGGPCKDDGDGMYEFWKVKPPISEEERELSFKAFLKSKKRLFQTFVPVAVGSS